MATAATPASIPSAKKEIRIVSHSTIFYWWPVWVVGYLMAVITLFSNTILATVPEGTIAGYAVSGQAELDNQGKLQELKGRFVLIAPEQKDQPKDGAAKQTRIDELRPKLQISRSKNLGVLFCTVLLLVIVITSVPLRGLWSVIVIILIILLSVIFALIGVWESILDAIDFLDIRINLGGYVFIATVLLIVWLVVIFLFDQQIYMIFTPGQFRVCLEIGEGETTYDTTGMTVHKQRSDLFRHWILGLGSGDLIVRTSGAQAHHFDLPNVLFLGRRVKEIEEMLRSRPVVAAPQS